MGFWKSQPRHGGIVLEWGRGGNMKIILNKEQAEIIALDIPDFAFSDYNKFYNVEGGGK